MIQVFILPMLVIAEELNVMGLNDRTVKRTNFKEAFAHALSTMQHYFCLLG